MAKKYTIKVVCNIVEGHEDDWIEFDTSEWGLDTFVEMGEGDIFSGLTKWIRQDSIDWHLTSDKGDVIPHPGRGAQRSAWQASYKALGPEEGLKMEDWLGSAAWIAMGERRALAKKSEAGSAGTGEG